MNLKIKIALVFVALVSTLGAQTQIYRSMQGGKTSAVATNAIGTLTISGSTATFSAAVPDCVGVGDVVNYGVAQISIAFIHGRTSSTVFTVKTSTGGTPTSVSGDTGWNIYRAYTTVGSWESGTENTGIPALVRNFDAGNRNLVSNNEQWHVACYMGTNPGEDSFNIAGWTMDDATGNYVRIYAPYLSTEVGRSQRHSGVEVSPFPYMRLNSGVFMNTGGADIKMAIRFEGLVSIMTSISCENFDIQDCAAGSNITFEDCIFFGRNGSGCGGTTAGIQVGVDFNGTVKIKNCIFYNFDGSGNNSGAGSHAAISYTNQTSTGTIHVSNITDYNSNYTIKHSEPGGAVVVKNSVSQASDTFGFFTEGGAAYHADSDYNLSDRASPDAPGTHSKRSRTVAFINSASNNFHLATTDTTAGNSGTDLSADANLPVTTDIDRDARPSSYVDMGADEGVASPASSSTQQSKRKYFLRRNQ